MTTNLRREQDTMATATKKTADKKKPGTGLAKWDEQLAKYAQEAAATEANTGAGLKTFSLKSGVLSLDDQAMPNNEMAVIVLDHVLENIYYGADFDVDNPTPPICFAFGRDETIAPHKNVVERDQQQHDKCAGCPMNEYGTASRGRGKACANKRRLLCIPAGSFTKQGEFKFIDDVEHYEDAQPAFLKLPTTSTTAWALYVKQLAGALRRPPFAVVTKIKVVPDAKSTFKVQFEAIQELDDEDLMEVLIKRHEEARKLIEQPYNLDAEEQEEKPKGKGAKGKPAAKKAPVKTARKKY